MNFFLLSLNILIFQHITSGLRQSPLDIHTADQGHFGTSLTSAVSLGASSTRVLSSLRVTRQQTGVIRQLAE